MSTVAAPPASRIPQFINGQWVESHAAEWQDVLNPATGEVLGRVPISDAVEVTRAIDAAQAAYPEWRRTPAEDRIQPLFKLKMLMEEHHDDLARIITQENGKTFTEAKA
ncbi:MAG: aldehyde dehydrogenase family protein, partial [Terriglobales bacterium]